MAFVRIVGHGQPRVRKCQRTWRGCTPEPAAAESPAAEAAEATTAEVLLVLTVLLLLLLLLLQPVFTVLQERTPGKTISHATMSQL